MKTPIKITYIPKTGLRAFNGPARAIAVNPRRSWRKQIDDWLKTTPTCDSALVEFNDDTFQHFFRK